MDTERILRAHPGWLITASAAPPVVLCWLMSLAGTGLPNSTAAIALVLPVVAAAATGQRWAGVAAALGAATAFDFFLTQPFHTLQISDPADLETGALLLVVGLAVSEIAVRSRRHQARLSREQGYLDGLLRIAGTVAAGSATADQLIDVVRRQLVDLLGLDDCRFDRATTYGLPRLDAEGGLVRRDRVVDIGRLGLPTDTAIALPVRAGGSVLGHFVLTAATRVQRPSREQLRVAVMLADQVGTALAATQHHQGR
ncbi:MAG: DUF4118 domain-containing protein [Nakamurella sp.]